MDSNSLAKNSLWIFENLLFWWEYFQTSANGPEHPAQAELQDRGTELPSHSRILQVNVEFHSSWQLGSRHSEIVAEKVFAFPPVISFHPILHAFLELRFFFRHLLLCFQLMKQFPVRIDGRTANGWCSWATTWLIQVLSRATTSPGRFLPVRLPSSG